MSFRLIDMESYARRAHFEYFRTLQYPYAGTTVNVDVTGLLAFCRNHHLSFYLTFLHIAALAADAVPELRQRIRSNGIIEYTQCPTSHIELLENNSYCYCTLHHHMDFEQYYAQAEKARAACKSGGITEDSDVESMYFISTMPWLHYTSLIQPVSGGDESNPRITWGKYEVNHQGRMMMPVSILVHHALVDGIHIALFYENLKNRIAEYSE